MEVIVCQRMFSIPSVSLWLLQTLLYANHQSEKTFYEAVHKSGLSRLDLLSFYSDIGQITMWWLPLAFPSNFLFRDILYNFYSPRADRRVSWRWWFGIGWVDYRVKRSLRPIRVWLNQLHNEWTRTNWYDMIFS